MAIQDRDTSDQAREYGAAAMASMAQLRIAPTPRNFAIWYAYHTGRDGKLTAAIDLLLKNQQEFNERLCDELYDQFVSTDQPQKVLSEIGHRLEEVVGRMTTLMGEAEQGTRRYGEQLERFAGEAEGTTEKRQLQQLVGQVLSETRHALTEVRNLETRIDSSSKEIASLRTNLDHVRREALTDALTGIANRKLFDFQLVEAARVAIDGEMPLTLLICDIDHFKQFNDTWGHQLGDLVLKLVAKVLAEGLKGRDLPARYGGEEFAVILPGTPLENAVAVAEQLRRTLQSRKLVKKTSGEDMGRISMSVGVAAYRPGEPLSRFIERADKALYTAKRHGRNRVVSEAMVDSLQHLTEQL